jgi:protein-S-isoprenylcysteine O-methyltransferase Ste14
MRRSYAAIGTAAFFLAAPGVVAGLVPWWITRWQSQTPFAGWAAFRLLGGALILAGAAFLIHAFARFVTEGAGTPAPVAPTERLVVGGVYRYVRNPMYLAVLAVIVGQALVLGQLHLLTYAGIVGAAMAAFVRWYEEPMLARQFGREYDEYRREVPGWWPRFTKSYRNRTYRNRT